MMQKESLAYLLSRFFSGPLEALFTLFIFILSKNLNLTPLQLSCLVAIKPLSSALGYYISSFIFERKDFLRPYLFFNTALGAIPCLFFPFFDSPWAYIGAYATFMVSFRATGPAWLEILKKNPCSNELSKAICYGNNFNQFLMIFLVPALCYLMDLEKAFWLYAFAGFSALKMVNFAIVLSITPQLAEKRSNKLVNPFKKGYEVIRDNPSYGHYLALYGIGGVSIIVSQTILPVYFNESLNLSYKELGFAFSFCKAVSYLATSPYWLKLNARFSLFKLNSLANLFSCLYFLSLIFASQNIFWLYCSYLFYGAMLSGCELSSNLAGPIFSKEKNSTVYSSLILAVSGIRGVIFPFLASLLFGFTGTNAMLIFCIAISFTALLYGYFLDIKQENEKSWAL